jgi:hypothetical protein
MTAQRLRKTQRASAGEIAAHRKSTGAIKSRKELITSLLSKIEGQLDSEKTRVTLTDFIRLVQLQRELEQEEQPAEVIVTWKDRSEKRSSGR